MASLAEGDSAGDLLRQTPAPGREVKLGEAEQWRDEGEKRGRVDRSGEERKRRHNNK